ncbi:exonuclease 1 [Perkinsela sp. CCAP 1560/4]|nr:exonuclease 1 [Perkinsela sp. CCAP 1560/4]|eukprot:KNH07587.1 exonuclease 1 [Perkinsela sp. CCAP 1560/4]
MTVSGFRQFIQPLIRTQQVSEVPHVRKTLRIGIDATQYIYKAMYFWRQDSSIDKLVQTACNLCTSAIPDDVESIFVFDGQRVLLKNRSKSALLNKVEHYNTKKYYGTSANFTIPPSITHSVARQLEKYGSKCIVAPFEADAQLAYLSQRKHIDAVLSLDIDSLIFGCDVLLQKLQKSSKSVEVVQRKNIMASMGVPVGDNRLVHAASVLGGSDYACSLRGVSFQRALEWIRLYGSLEDVILRIYDAYLSMEKMEQFKHFPEGMQRLVRHYHRNGFSEKKSFADFLMEYASKLEKAMYCLRHHIVYDEARVAFIQQNVTPKNASPPPLSLLSFSPNTEHFHTEDINTFICRLRDIKKELCPIKSVFGNTFPDTKAASFCKTFSLSLR